MFMATYIYLYRTVASDDLLQPHNIFVSCSWPQSISFCQFYFQIEILTAKATESKATSDVKSYAEGNRKYEWATQSIK